MKRKVFVSLLLALSLLLSLAVFARAEAQIDFVNDYAGVLTDGERQSLNERAREISEQYGFGVYVVIVGDYRDFVNGSIENFAEEVFHSYGLGWGESENGVILAMSMDDRDYDIYAHGDFGNYAFTDYGKKELANTFLDNFRRNDWAGGFQDYVNNCEAMLKLAKGGKPLDIWIPDEVEEGPGLDSFELLMSLVIGCVVGGITVAGMKKQMKTAVKQTRAANYVAQGGVHLRGKRDDFVNRTVSRQVIRHESSSSHRSGGGHFGGTTISGSHGGSHHSGKF